MNTLSERIRWVMQHFSLTQAELARICGIKQPSVNRWVSGATETINSESALRLCERYPINLQWLISGVGEPLFKGEGISSIQPSSAYSQRAVRLFHLVAQTDPRLQPKLDEMDMSPKYYDQAWLDEHGLKVENLQAFIVTDDGLSPFINEGDIVTVDMTQTTIENGRVYAFVYSGKLCVRRLRVLLNGDLQTIPSDSRSVETILKDQTALLHILGKVVDRSGSHSL